jgi:carboxyl-terminal processing protease
VLVNGRSASAAEVVAAALQDRGRARLVGTRTFGKGTVQTVYEHRDGSALRLTVARYLTPSGAPVAPREGRTPDVVVPWPGEGSPRDALRAAIEALDVEEADRVSLRAHVDALPDAELRSVRSPIPWDLPLQERLPVDPQLAAALDASR